MGKTKKKGSQKETVEAQNLRDERNGRWWYIWAALVALVAVLVMLTWTITLFSRSSTNTDSLSSKQAPLGVRNNSWTVSGEVSVKVLSSPDASFARSCTKSAVPVVLKNTIVKKWQAQKWSPTYLRTKLKILHGIYENENRWFGPYFTRTKPLLRYAVRKNPYKTDTKLSSEEFFHRLDNPTGDRYHYFSGDIDQLGDWAYSEIQPVQELLLPNPKRSSINVWIGQPHVIAHCHYDGYHNFYAQLYGIKKFTLFRPTNWPGLYPYPFLHPSHAQAQINASSEEEVERFALVRKVEAVEVVLGPGDLLYIPPLWFHEVESLSVSISVNVWTDSQQTELVERIFSLPLPLDYTDEVSHGHEHVRWRDARERRLAASVLIYQLLERVCRYQSCRHPKTDRFLDSLSVSMPKYVEGYFVHQLWSTRYKHLMLNGELPEVFHEGEHILCEGGDKQAAVSASEAILKDVHYGAYVEQVSQLVRGLPLETWELWFGNYVEYIAASAVEVEYVGLFLKHFSSCTV